MVKGKRAGEILMRKLIFPWSRDPVNRLAPQQIDQVSSGDPQGFMRSRILGGLRGSLVGDALGVPVEFKKRSEILTNPVTGMREYGTHNQPRGTWSDDGALILCTAESLLHAEFDLQDLGERFVRWMSQASWTATGKVFDIGMTTADSLIRIARGTVAESAGSGDEYSNGNGSLMRILPVALRFANAPVTTFAERIERASAITHAHARSKMACVLFGLVVRKLLFGSKPQTALDSARDEFAILYEASAEFRSFRGCLLDDFRTLREDDISSSGYVLHTLHASLWCLVTAGNFRDCVLRAVNLGYDTDTTGCVAGGLAGVAYGADAIPLEWNNQLAKHPDLDRLLTAFADLCIGHSSLAS